MVSKKFTKFIVEIDDYVEYKYSYIRVCILYSTVQSCMYQENIKRSRQIVTPPIPVDLLNIVDSSNTSK